MKFQEDIALIVKDDSGNELLEIINIEEEKADANYKPINHCLAVVKVGSDYLLGWNRYRQDVAIIDLPRTTYG